MRIALEHLGKRFGRTVALDDLSLEIQPGRIVALLGENGAGKSTLLHLLSGLLVPTAGWIEYDGELFQRDRIDLRKRLALLPDIPPVLRTPSTVIQHIGMYLRLYEAHRPDIESLAVALLRDFDLLPLAEVQLIALSRGQMYKAALCGLIAADPEVWLLDEPFASGMDPRGLSAFRRYAQKAAGRGRTILYSTQIVEVAETFSDEVIILSGGRVRVQGTVDALRQNNANGDGGGNGASGGDDGQVLARLLNQREPQP